MARMKTLYITLILIASTGISFAGNNAKEIEAGYRRVKENDSKTEAFLDDLKDQLLSNKDYSSLSEYARLIVYYFKRSNHYEYSRNTLLALTRSADIPDSVRTDVHIQELWLDVYSDNFTGLVSKTDSLIQVRSSALQKGWINYFRGQGQNETGNYDTAYQSYLESFKLFEKLNYKEGMSYAQTGLGDIQRNIKYLEKAIPHYTRGLALAREAKNTDAEINALLLLGMASGIDKKYVSAIDYYHQALRLAKELKDNSNTARALNNLGNAHLRNNDLERALEANQASLQLCLENDMVYGAIVNYMNIANLYNQRKEFHKAITNIKAGFVYLGDKNLPAEKAELLRNFSEAYEGLGDYQNAYTFYREYHKERENLLNEKTAKVVKELQVKYESELKDKQLEKSGYDLKLKESQNRFLLVCLLSLFIIGGFIVFLLVYRNRKLRDLYNQNVENLYVQPYTRSISDKTDSLYPIYERILMLLETEKIYKKPTLSLTELAELIGTNEKYVSTAISKYAESNYSNFINRYRINDAKRLLFENPDMNVNEVMIGCGFNSRTSFYNSFTKFTGISPKQFKEMRNA